MPSPFRLAATILLLTAFAWPQQAADKKKTVPPDPCPHADTTLARNECLGDLYQKADTRLNALYQKIQQGMRTKMSQEQASLRGYHERALDKLKTAESAWIHYRDAQCDASEQQFEGGTISTSVRLGCMKDLTEQRTAELQKTYAIYLLP